MESDSLAKSHSKTEVLIEPKPHVVDRKVIGYTLPADIKISKKDNYVTIKAPRDSAMIFALYRERDGYDKCKDPGPFKSVGVYLAANTSCRHDLIEGRAGREFGCLAFLVREGLIAVAEAPLSAEEAPVDRRTSRRSRSERPKIHVAI
jgi:hypothetical protein